jgi:hypothetical protein
VKNVAAVVWVRDSLDDKPTSPMLLDRNQGIAMIIGMLPVGISEINGMNIA